MYRPDCHLARDLPQAQKKRQISCVLCGLSCPFDRMSDSHNPCEIDLHIQVPIRVERVGGQNILTAEMIGIEMTHHKCGTVGILAPKQKFGFWPVKKETIPSKMIKHGTHSMSRSRFNFLNAIWIFGGSGILEVR
jgi:hypothetical protein